MSERCSGILLPLFSLPGKYGIGTMGKEAREFIDFLAKAKQKRWQVLPLGPTGYGDSPYQNFSAFAGNPYFIDLDKLTQDGLLTEDECNAFDWGADKNRIDYEKIYNCRFKLLKGAFERGKHKFRVEFCRFKEENSFWLDGYALYMAVKSHFNMSAWTCWDEDIKFRSPGAVERYKNELSAEVEFYSFLQYLFFTQWEELRKYANLKGIKIIGDMPIYVAMDSADVWEHPNLFQLDEDYVPSAVAGVPPDAFSKTGQLWGNPLYRWDVMKEDGYNWWINRVGNAAKLFDFIRIDHFRGFESYWAIPYGSQTAAGGEWQKGPGEGFVKILTEWFDGVEFIAEDLGILTDEVRKMQKKSGLPGMKILEFAFDSRRPSDYLPYKYEKNSVCYTGTHDNDTLYGWLDNTSKSVKNYVSEFFGVSADGDIAQAVIKGGMGSVSDLFIAQLQDFIGVSSEGRINTPGTDLGNWVWRVDKKKLTGKTATQIAKLTRLYGRD